jgi:hypothetical protein
MSFSIRANSRSSGKTQYAPATIAADVARIVDPTYTFGNASPTHPTILTYHQPKAYVDASGDMHDPDYRAFPALPSPASSRRNSASIRTPSYGYSSEDAYSSPRAEPINFYHRPSFEESVVFEDLHESEEQTSSVVSNDGRSRLVDSFSPQHSDVGY